MGHDNTDINKGIHFNNAPKKSGQGIKFDEYQATRSNYPETPKIIRWIMKHSGGLLKHEKHASYLISGLIVLFLVIAVILFSNAFRAPSKPPAGYEGNIPDLPEYRNPPNPQDFR